MEDTSTAKSHPLTSPFCVVRDLQTFGHNSARCEYCRGLLGGALVHTLLEIIKLLDVLGAHACECGHPEMRLLPDGVYRCPACGSEIAPA